MTQPKIFIQIASYRDPELLSTINDCIEKAMYPHRLVFGICWQHDETENLGKYTNDKRFKIIDVDFKKSKGCCWARAQIQKLYAGEEYTLQIDSHMRFVKNWDYIAEKMLNDLQRKGFRKPLLTCYPPSYEPGSEINLNSEPQFMKFHEMNNGDGHITCTPEVIPNFSSLYHPIPGRFIAAGFIFTQGIFCNEVPYDPQLYFNGEETNLAVRAFSNGYDIFHPHRTLLFHYYTRSKSKKHWNDLEWEQLNTKSSERIKKLLNNYTSHELGEFGMGSVRNLNDYEKYAGICFDTKQITPNCILDISPSFNIIYDDVEWKKTLVSQTSHIIAIKQELLNYSYDYIVVAYRDESGKDIYRKDISGEDLEEFYSNIIMGHYSIKSTFYEIMPVYMWIVMPRKTDGKWGRPITGKMS